ncbi:MAG: RdgB/HAM1 family non-canonical purine NTP pyrophosphatase [Alcanivorax sp.]
MRKFESDELLIATHNKGKAREIAELLQPYVSKFCTAGDLNLPEPEETGDTFQANAILKAKAAALASGKVCLADDSGLAVNALNGDPGIFSARWGGPEKDFNLAMHKVHEALGDNPDRSAYFVCVLAMAWPDGHTETFEGRVNGAIIWPMRGEKGFGYDPVFQADGYDVTFAEMNPVDKHAISHRANAFELLVQNCLSRD